MAADLDRTARQHLRGLAKDNADRVARHLVMAESLIDEDPELAYRHARAAADRAGRIDVVRQAAGLAAYRTGRYAEALRELRTFRRLTGSWSMIALEADCERGLGRPERAVDIAKEAMGAELSADEQAELIVVLAGARGDLGDAAAGIAEIDRVLTARWSPTARARLKSARLLLLGEDVPDDLLEVADPIAFATEDVSVFDIEEDFDERLDEYSDEHDDEDDFDEDSEWATKDDLAEHVGANDEDPPSEDQSNEGADEGVSDGDDSDEDLDEDDLDEDSDRVSFDEVDFDEDSDPVDSDEDLDEDDLDEDSDEVDSDEDDFDENSDERDFDEDDEQAEGPAEQPAEEGSVGATQIPGEEPSERTNSQ